MRKLTILFALLCASMMSFAIDWSGYSWIGNGSGNAAYTEAMKIDLPGGFSVVNLQSSFGTEAGIYITTPSAAGLTCDLGDGKFAVQGTGMLLYLSAFTLKETPVTVTSGGTDYIVTVYWKDGAEGGGGSTPAPGEKFVAADASINSVYIAPGWAEDVASEATVNYNSSTGAITASILNALGGQWQGQIKLNLGFAYNASKYYDFSIKFHASKAIGGVTLKSNNDNALFYEDQSISLPADADYVWTKSDVAGVAGDNIFVFDFGWAAAGTDITISEISIIEKDEPSTPPTPVDPNDYTVGGHTIHLEAYYVNDIYTLNITSTDNMEGLGGSFWNVNGVGADMRTNTGTSSYTVSGDKKTITCQVQSSSAPNIYTPLYVLMPGEVNFGNVTLNWEDRTPITSEYCNYQDPQTIKGGKNIALTWETDGSGNVIITMQNGIGASSCSFRNGGFEGGIGAFVVSNDDFVTTTPASDYFTAAQVYSGNTYTLTKIADLPANAKIKHVGSGHALAWVLNGNNEYCFPDFIYTYGGTCNQLDAPANVAIDANNILTFEAVSGADSYMAYVSLGGVEKYSQAVASGDELTYTALVTGDYIINVVASGAGKVDSDPSADVVWHLEAAPVVLGNSEYCEHVFMADDNREAAFTWETDGDGNIVITISATRGDAAATHFRGNGMALANFKVGAGKADASTYFNHACGGSNQVTLSLKNPANAPALGEKIYFNNTVEYATSLDGNAWPTLNFEWTYGTICSGKSVSASVNNNTMGSAVVQKAGVDVTSVDDGDEVTFMATVADAELYRFVNWTKAGAEVSTNATYVTTIHETTNLIANFEYIRNVYCQYPVTATSGGAIGKKLYLTIGAVSATRYQIKFEGSAEAPLLGLNNADYVINGVTALTDVDGQNKTGNDVPFTKTNDRWNFSATGNGSAWIQFDLADGRTIDDIYVWGNHIFFNTPLGELGYEDNASRNKLFGDPAPLRHNIDWDATCSDTEAPVMVSAVLDHKTASSAILNVSATDAHLDAYHVIDAINGIDVVVPATAQITVEGLVGGTTYNLTVKAVDVTGNESAAGINVEVVMAATISAPTTAPADPTWPAAQVISFYSDKYTAPNTWNFRAPWGGSTVYEQVVIEGNNIIHYSTLDYVGWIYEAGGTPYNAINMEKLHLDIWVADDCTIGIVPIYGGDGLTTDDNKRKKPALTGQQWNSIDLDLATDYAGLDLASIFQFKFDQATTTEFWVDNVYFYRTTELVDNEAPTNVSASVAAEGFYSVKLTVSAEDNMGAVNFSVKNGDVEVATGASASGVATTITVSNLTPGTAYNFTIIAKDDKPNEAAPVAVNATTKALPAAAPTPDFSGKLVIPVFTDAMACAVSGIQSGGWGETTQVEWLDIAEGDKVFYGQNFNYAGWHSWGGGDIDATTMQYLHVDIYSTGMTAVNVTPISAGHEGSATISLTPNAWTSYDVPLSVYDANNIDWANIFQFKFMGPVGGNELLIDNVYFWKAPDYTRDDSWMAPGELGTICIPNGAVATGGDLYTLEGKDSNGKIVFATVTNNEMQPGVPYLFQATSNAMNFFYTDATPAPEPVNTGAMKGSFTGGTTLTGDQLNGVYYFNGHALWSAAALTELEVIANRAYVYMPDVQPINTSNPAPGRRYIIMDVHGQNATTGFGEIQGDEVYTKVLIDGQLFILRGEKMYNANGQLVK